MKSDKRLRTFAGFILLMMALGVSDCIRGIFTPIFSDHFGLSASQLSNIITVSYLGNLIFLLLGGGILDRVEHRRSLLGLTLIWMASLTLYLLTDDYYLLMLGMFFSMGSSTLLSTSINLYASMLFAASPGMAVNFLFFTQSIGTSGGQSLVGNLATGFHSWKLVNLILLLFGAVSLLILAGGGIPERSVASQESSAKSGSPRQITASPAFLPLILIFASYFVAEHGIMNWLVAYANLELGISMGAAANYTAVFFGGIMAGRLLFSPLVDRLGPLRSMRLTVVAAAAPFITGVLSDGRLLWLLSASGLFFSILYPTLVMSIAQFYPPYILSSATGVIISIATLGDILFNAVFGRVVDAVGYSKAFLILPCAMAICTVSLYVFTLWGERYEKRSE